MPFTKQRLPAKEREWYLVYLLETAIEFGSFSTPLLSIYRFPRPRPSPASTSCKDLESTQLSYHKLIAHYKQITRSQDKQSCVKIQLPFGQKDTWAMGMFLLLFIAQQRKEQKCPQLIVLTKESCSYGCHPINQIMDEHDWHPDFFFPSESLLFQCFYPLSGKKLDNRWQQIPHRDILHLGSGSKISPKSTTSKSTRSRISQAPTHSRHISSLVLRIYIQSWGYMGLKMKY